MIDQANETYMPIDGTHTYADEKTRYVWTYMIMGRHQAEDM